MQETASPLFFDDHHRSFFNALHPFEHGRDARFLLRFLVTRSRLSRKEDPPDGDKKQQRRSAEEQDADRSLFKKRPDILHERTSTGQPNNASNFSSIRNDISICSSSPYIPKSVMRTVTAFAE